MILKELLKKYSVKFIERKILEIFPEQNEQVKYGEYRYMIKKLLRTKPLDSKYMINIKNVDTEFHKGVDVLGIDTTIKGSKIAKQALEFTPWNEWLGMTIDKKSLKDFTELEILAYCLDEMSFCGFNEEIIKKTIDAIEEVAEGVFKEDGCKSNFVPLNIDWLLKELENAE